MIPERIQEPNIFGYRLDNGDRTAEAIRCYPGSWAVFYYIRGVMLRGPNLERFAPQTAMKHARAFVIAPVGFVNCAGRQNQLPGRVCAICGKATHEGDAS